MFGSKTRQITELADHVRRLERENRALSGQRYAVSRLLERWEDRHVAAWITNALRDALAR